ncbi:MAG: hypothetical protein MJ014_00190 [Methanocorpusculum sp.]|nr:hypothetical protein [Methanocorpusculum sp.]
MLKLRLPADAFKEFLDAASVLVNEVRLNITGDGEISYRTVDSANVAMVSASLARSVFSMVDVPSDGTELGLDIEKLRSVLTFAKNEDVTLTHDAAKNNVLQVDFGNYRSTIALIDAKTIRKDPAVPTSMIQELPVSFTITGSALVDALKGAMSVAENSKDTTVKILIDADSDARTLKITGKREANTFSAAGWKDESIQWDDGEKTGKAHSGYSHDYLSSFTKPLSRAGAVRVKVGNDHPIYFSFAFANEQGVIHYLLAPRIEQDEK